MQQQNELQAEELQTLEAHGATYRIVDILSLHKILLLEHIATGRRVVALCYQLNNFGALQIGEVVRVTEDTNQPAINVIGIN